ncbi:hypothetical protein ACKWTF_010402 [Chironomus riparius]
MLQMLMWIKLLLLGLLFEKTYGNIEDEATVVRKVEAVIGKYGHLSCNLTSDIRDDRIALVIWYKEGKTTPIYSYDARDSNAIDGGSHHGMNSDGKYYFNTSSLNPASFAIANLTADDEGTYRCRVDFHRSPTKNTKVQLYVIVPPDNILILNELNRHISHYILGPYNEGSSINLTCISQGGRPQPKLTWWHNNQLLDTVDITRLSDKKVRNVLYLKNLDRKNLLSSYTCQSSNNNLTDPITSSVMIDLNLRPLSVKIMKDLKFMSTKQKYNLKCEVRGSRPAPKISWWLGSTMLTNTSEMMLKDGNATGSVLTFIPNIEDQGKFLSCRAENPQIPDSGVEDGFKLNLHHEPLIKLELGTNPVVEGNTVGEGADVYFECNIKANPPVYRVAWKHNENDLHNNPQEGIIIRNQSLVLQNISRVRLGEYVCIASNSEGDGYSQPVQLNVLYAPICRPGLPQTYSVDRGEIANIKCEVESNPMAHDFRWKFNSSFADFTELQTSDDVKSILDFKPQSENDYMGTVLCWGINSIGMQTEPCVFQVVPAGKPEPLSNCTVVNQTQNSFQVLCVEGDDGGFPQDFVAELYYAREKYITNSISSRVPIFDLKGLNPGQEYDIVLSAINKKGRSSSYVISAYTLKMPEKHTDLALSVTTALMQKREILMMVAGSVIGIIVIALLITIVAKMRGTRRLESKAMVASSLPSLPSANDNESCGNLDQHQHYLHQESPDSSDKNPDIIPHTTLEEWQEANQKQIYGSMHYRIPTAFSPPQSHLHQLQPQTAASAIAAYNNSNTANGMIIYSGATLGRPHMNNNFKRIDSNGICAQQFDLASPPLQQHYQKYYLQQQQQHHSINTQTTGLVIASYQTAPLTGLNTAQQHTTLDRFPTPPSPSLFVSASTTNPVCNSNEPRSFEWKFCCRSELDLSI